MPAHLVHEFLPFFEKIMLKLFQNYGFDIISTLFSRKKGPSNFYDEKLMNLFFNTGANQHCPNTTHLMPNVKCSRATATLTAPILASI